MGRRNITVDKGIACSYFFFLVEMVIVQSQLEVWLAPAQSVRTAPCRAFSAEHKTLLYFTVCTYCILQRKLDPIA